MQASLKTNDNQTILKQIYSCLVLGIVSRILIWEKSLIDFIICI